MINNSSFRKIQDPSGSWSAINDTSFRILKDNSGSTSAIDILPSGSWIALFVPKLRILRDFSGQDPELSFRILNRTLIIKSLRILSYPSGSWTFPEKSLRIPRDPEFSWVSWGILNFPEFSFRILQERCIFHCKKVFCPVRSFIYTRYALQTSSWRHGRGICRVIQVEES